MSSSEKNNIFEVNYEKIYLLFPYTFVLHWFSFIRAPRLINMFTLNWVLLKMTKVWILLSYACHLLMLNIISHWAVFFYSSYLFTKCKWSNYLVNSEQHYSFEKSVLWTAKEAFPPHLWHFTINSFWFKLIAVGLSWSH